MPSPDPSPAMEALAASVQRARELRRDGQTAAAVSLLDPLVRNADAPWMLQHELAQALAMDGRPEDAVALFERAAAGGGAEVPGLWVNLGNACRSCGRKAAARDAYASALALDATLAAAWFNRHAAVYSGADPAEAQVSLERALALRPDHVETAFHLAALRSRHGGAPPSLASSAPDFMKSSLAFVQEHADAAWFADTFDTLVFALDAAPDDGAVLELGVRRGTTLRFLADRVAPRAVYGFDSFEGLPEAWGPQPRGLYDAGGERPAVPANAQLVAGWFAESLPEFVDEEAPRVRLVHVDCDLYSSTRDGLNALAPTLVEGAVLVFDEYLMNPGWEDEEHRALMEVAEREGWRVAYLAFSLFTRQAVVRLR